MTKIQEIINKYKDKIDYLDLEILIAHSLGKTREFVLIHPEHKLPSLKIKNLKLKISRRMRGEPIAYILGHKEFYGLDFKVDKHTLVPRPETEQIVDLVLDNLQQTTNNKQQTIIADIGTGSGNIIISITNKLKSNTKYQTPNTQYYATDISAEALKIAKKNAKIHDAYKKIKFLHGNLLEPLKNELSCSTLHDPCSMIITANLPYLSKEIYDSTSIDVKKYEPKSALYSPEDGLQHYRKLLEQIKEFYVPCSMFHACLSGRQVSCFMEISPEQKQPLAKLIKSVLPESKIEFHKDLARKWRICKIEIK